MKKFFCGLCCVLFSVSIITISWKPAENRKPSANAMAAAPATALLQAYIDNIYESAHLQESGLGVDVFRKAITGFVNLKAANKIAQNSSVVTVVDYTLSSCEKRMWIIDVVNKSLILNTWVAHGRGSGDSMATSFSDKQDSHKSSLGFYITNKIYFGENGRSLKLDGLDAGFNKGALARDIVVHGADYVSQGTIDHLGMLGRSWGCPAVSRDVIDQVIDNIKDGTVLFINGNSKNYTSKYLDEELAGSFISQNNSDLTASL